MVTDLRNFEYAQGYNDVCSVRFKFPKKSRIPFASSPMTEPVLAIATPATALAEYLAAVPLIPYLGSLTPQHLDAPELETKALLTGAAAHDLGWLRRIAVRGEDRFRWLSGMITNVVEGLPDRSGAYNLVLNAQGRIQGDAYVWRSGDALELELTAEQAETLLTHLDRFIIMDDVELVPLTGDSALGLTGPNAGKVLEKLGLSALPELQSCTTCAVAGIPVLVYRTYGTLLPHYILWTGTTNIPMLWDQLLAAGASAVGAAAVETMRIVEGIPAYGVDIQSRDLAQETAQTRALNFTKGCYLGQEIVERIRSRGQVHRHLRAVEFTAGGNDGSPGIGTELRIAGSPDDSKSAGTLTSVTDLRLGDIRRIFGIAMVRAESEVGDRALVYPGGAASILHSPPKFN